MSGIGYIAGITFFLRALPGILRINPTGSDPIYHLMLSERIREGKFRYPREMKGFLNSGRCIDAGFFHYLLALLPKTAREFLSPFYSAIIDTVHVILIYLFTLYILHQPELSSIVSSPSLVASVAALLFATSPALLYLGVGPRAYSASPRILGELLITITFFCFAIYYWEGIWWMALLSCLFAGLTLTTSRFSTQVLLFFSIIMVLLLRFPLMLILPILGIIFALMLSKGHYKLVLYGHLKHVIRFCRLLRQFSVADRNSLTPFKDALVNIKSGNITKALGNIQYTLYNNTFAILVSRNVLLLLLAYFVITDFSFITSNKIMIFLISWTAASFVTFILVSIKPFLFLGEAERYLEHSVPAQVILLSFFLLNIKGLTPLLSYHLLFYILTLVMLYISHRAGSEDRRCKQELFDWFRLNNISGKNILPGLGGHIHYELAFWTDNNVLYPAGERWLNYKEFGLLYEEFPYPNANLKMLIEKYALDLIVVRKPSLEYAAKRGWIYDLSPYTKVFENDIYLVYETSGPQPVEKQN
jgi:hypothetical protein